MMTIPRAPEKWGRVLGERRMNSPTFIRLTCFDSHDRLHAVVLNVSTIVSMQQVYTHDDEPIVNITVVGGGVWQAQNTLEEIIDLMGYRMQD
jgi:hypothetical protein